MSQACGLLGIGWDTAQEIMRRAVQRGLERRQLDRLKYLGDLEDVRTLRNNNEYLVKAIYHFFRSVCESPSFTLSDWFMLYHSGSMDDSKN